MKKLITICVMAGLIMGVSGTAQATDPTALSNSLANLLKTNQADVNNDGTKDLWGGPWSGDGGSWTEYGQVIWAPGVGGLGLHNNAASNTAAGNALTYFFTTNHNWAQKAGEDATIGTGGSAFFADASFVNSSGTGDTALGVPWAYHGLDWGGKPAGRRLGLDNVDNMVIGTTSFAMGGYYSEASTLADAIMGYTGGGPSYLPYWSTDHIVTSDGVDDDILLTTMLKASLKMITAAGEHDYSTEIAAIDAWHGGYGSDWNEAIDHEFGSPGSPGAAGEDWGSYFRYVWYTKLFANEDALSAQNVADNVVLDDVTYPMANILAIQELVDNGQSGFASEMTQAMIDKYWDGVGIINTSMVNRAAGHLLLANEVAPVPEPGTLVLLALGGLTALTAVWIRRRRGR